MEQFTRNDDGKSQSIKFIINLYTDCNPLWAKHVTHHKAESLTATSVSKKTTRSTTTLSTKYAEFSIKW